MSYSFVLRIVKDLSRSDFVKMLKLEASDDSVEIEETIPGAQWSFDDVVVGENIDHSLLTIYIADRCNWGAKSIDFLRGCSACVTVCRLDEDCWTYVATQGGKVVDRFATLPDKVAIYDLRDTLRGDPEVLRSILNLNDVGIERYLHWWRTPKDLAGYTEEEEDEYWEKLDVSGKAFHSDEYAYGDGWQIFDFVRALGAAWPPKNDGKWSQFKVRDLSGC